MKLGVRAKLFGISVLLVIGGVATAGVFLETELRERLDARIEAELARHAASARVLIDRAAPDDDIAHIDPLADQLGAATGMRVTVIDASGRVLGDSRLSRDQVTQVENHGHRPEVLSALAQGFGRSRRHSTTLHTDLLYVALPVGGSHRGWIVRVARPLSEVGAAVARLRRQILFAGLIAIVAAGVMSLLTSHWMARTLRRLAANARSIARGEPGGRIAVPSTDELGRLAGSINRMAESVEETVSELATERARFKDVLEAMSEGVVALDDRRRVTLMNPAALAMFDLPRAPEGELLVDSVRTPALHELVTGEARRVRAVELDLGSPQRRVLAHVSPAHASNGCVIVLHDISELRRLELVRRDFVANVSHELRTPVSVMQANAETLLDGAIDDPDHARPMLEALRRNAERMSRLIGDLLDLSKLDAGRYELSTRQVHVAKTVQRAVDAVERSATRKNTTVAVDVSDHLTAVADGAALELVVINLLDNAIKYTPDGSHVVVRAQAAGDTVRLEVCDDGPGIPPTHRDRVFERFYRVDPGRSRAMGGTGLGLSIVKHLVEAMHGRLGVDAAEPHGARFWVELPADERAPITTAAP